MSDRRPLADRIRPTSLDEVAGQAHLVGPGGPLRQAIATGNIPSMVFWGPPGVGKTTLARLIAKESGRRYFELSAVSAGKDELRAIVAQASGSKSNGGLFDDEPEGEKAPILFLDEIHRFN
ncbi:MAG: AAA family ATPase, partial [Fimbriimonadaceae bacterium]|nr:AAA family ATPase [Fimbriimonadaceae bacterium]